MATTNFRKMFTTSPQIIDSAGKMSLAPSPVSPLQAPAGAGSGTPSYIGAVAGAPVFNKSESNDSHTVMVGGIPCVFRRSYGDI